MRTSFQQASLAVFLVVVCCVPACYAAPSIEVQLGLADQVVAQRFAPIHVSVDGLDHPVAGSLIVEQRVGNAWRGEAIATIELASGVLVNRTYSSIIPVHDPGNPFTVYIRNELGETVASHRLNLRDAQQAAPYSILVGRTAWQDESQATIEPFEIPGEWPGFDALSSVWIATPPTQAESWKTLAAWVLAGGSLVIGTGEDFYRLDTPLLREILPIRDPQLLLPSGATPRVAGELTADARVLVEREGAPLAVSGAYGAGEVTWVSVRLSDLTKEEARLIAERISPASIVSLEAAAASSFARLDVVRPSIAVAIGLGALVTLVFSAVIAYGRRHPRVAVALTLTLSALLSVSVALYTNRTNPTIASYSSFSGLTVSTSVSITFASSTFITIGDPSISLPILGGLLLQPDYTQDPQQQNYPSHVGATEAWAGTPPGQRGSYRALGIVPPRFELLLSPQSPDVVRVSNLLGKHCTGVILNGQTAYRLPAIQEGEAVYTLGKGETMESFDLPNLAFMDLYHQFVEDFALADSPWLLVFCEDSGTQLQQNTALRSRSSHLYAQRGIVYD